MSSSMALLGVLSSPSSSYSSSLISQHYDVFLSFRGEDTRNSFTSHLYHALDQSGINTYKDDEELRRGEEISPALLKAIEESKISIVIFSENYASSTWCLDELLKILECKESKQQKVIPVFFKVEPSTLRHPKDNFKEALAKHEDKFKDDAKVQRWKTGLNQVANLSGFHLKINEDEYEFIQKIVQDVSTSLPNRFNLHVAENPVGIQSHANYVIKKLLCIEENDTHMIGIFGSGGIGKTTIAKEIYNQLIAKNFVGYCFLADVRESLKQNQGRLGQLQEKILSNILGKSPRVDDDHQGMELIRNRLCCKKILLVLDDVDCLDQLKKLCGKGDWFGSGSRIIITTRDKSLLNKHGVSLNYRMREMEGYEARLLFTRHAFKSDKPIDGFEDLIKDALHYAGGLPLALKVVGSNLYGENREYWQSALKRYKRIPEENIQEKLKISYDGLDGFTKKIFLDIACFFKGDKKKYVTKILESCGFFPDDGIKKLNDKCLITIDKDDRLGVHDLLQDMGREIVRQQSPEEPGKRSRLWFHEDVCEVLETNKGTKHIEGILINLPSGHRKIRLGSEVFAKMKKLRILIARRFNEFFCGSLSYLSNELRVLDWPRCSLEILPSSFHGEKLIVLNISEANLRDLGTVLQSKNLTSIDLSWCVDLTNISVLSSCSNLEKLILRNCKSLVEVPDSVGFLDKLVLLDFRDCSSLKNLPRSFKLQSLELLELRGCTSLEYFPEIECEIEHLKHLEIESTVIQELPSSITYLTGLEVLFMHGCKSLVRFPINIFKLESLKEVFIIYCSNFVNFFKEVGHNGQSMTCTQENEISSCMEYFPLLPLESSNLSRTYNFSSSLTILCLRGNDIVSLPPCIEGFVGLSKLDLTSCKQLEEILHLPPNIEKVDARECSSLKNFLSESNNLSRTYKFSSSLRKLNLSRSDIVSLPPCIKRFVGLQLLYLEDCEQLEEILHLPPNIKEVNVRGCSSLKNFLPESNNLSRTYNFSSNLRELNLSGSGIISLPPCIQGFVGLSHLDLKDCKQLEEILHLPPNIEWVDASGCSSLKNFLPKSNNLSQTYNLSSSLRTLSTESLGTGLQSKNLTSIDLSWCVDLTNISDLSSCSNLEMLILRNCKSLVEVHDSVGFLDKLVLLDFRDCSSLKKLPRSFKLKCLELLKLKGCTSLEYFPEIECEIEHLEHLEIESTLIQELPSSITNLTGLNKLYLKGCKSLARLPINIYQLEHLKDVKIKDCPNFVEEVGHNRQSIPCTQENEISSYMEDFPLLCPFRTFNLPLNLRIFCLSSCDIVSLPPCIEGLVGLSKLDLTSCKQLEEILHLPPNIEKLYVRRCSSLKNFLPESNNLSQTYNFSSSLRKLNLSSSGIVSLPPCIQGFVELSHLDLKDCKQLEEILHLPPNIKWVDANGCSSLKNFLPESNNLSRTYNLSSSLRKLSLSRSGIVSLPPCIKGFVRLSELNLRDCKQLEEILHLPPNIEDVDAGGCMLLERFPHVSTRSSFGTPDLKQLTRINLSECNKVEVDVGNHAPDPLLVQERFWEKDSSTIIYPGSRIPEWFKYCKESTSYNYSIEIEIDHNAFKHQIVALVLCFVVRAKSFGTMAINGLSITEWIRPSTDPHRIYLKYIVGNYIGEILSRSYREGKNNLRVTFKSDSFSLLSKSVGVHLIYGKSKRY